MTRWLLALLLLAGCASAEPPGLPPLEVGVADVDITPPKGHRMAGYFYERRNTGTKDPLRGKAIVFRQGEMKAALVFCDLIGIPAALTSRVREEASRATGIPPEHIAVAATHSHTGPLFSGPLYKLLEERSGREETDYRDDLAVKLTDAVRRAAANCRAAELRAGIAEEWGLSFHRRFMMKDGTVKTNPGSLNPQIVNAMGPIDPELPVLLASAGGKPFASLTVFACHCDTVGGTEYSADYPYHLERELRASMGDGFLSLFGAGTCGNINHIDVYRKERRSAKEIGAALGQDVLSAIPRLERVAPRLTMKTIRVRVPRQTRSAEQVAQARADAGKIGSKEVPFLDQVRIVTTLHLDSLPPAFDFEVQVLRLGADTAIVLLPGEVFVELGVSIKRQSPFANTIVVELANDNPAYVPTRDAFKQGAYEVENSRIAPGGGEKLVDAAVRLLQAVFDVKP